jgi:hypothetical protein
LNEKIATKIEALLRLADPANNAPKDERRLAKQKAEELLAKYGPPKPKPEAYGPAYDWGWWCPPQPRVCPHCNEIKRADDFIWIGYWCWDCRHPQSD